MPGPPLLMTLPLAGNAKLRCAHRGRIARVARPRTLSPRQKVLSRPTNPALTTPPHPADENSHVIYGESAGARARESEGKRWRKRARARERESEGKRAKESARERDYMLWFALRPLIRRNPTSGISRRSWSSNVALRSRGRGRRSIRGFRPRLHQRMLALQGTCKVVLECLSWLQGVFSQTV